MTRRVIGCGVKVELSKEKRVKLLSFIILAGFVVAVFYHAVRGFYFGEGWPYNTFLFMPEDRFNDFFNSLTDPNLPYLPLCILVIKFFSFIKPEQLALLLFTMVYVGFMLYYVWSSLKQHKTRDRVTIAFILTFLTYPFLFLVDRSNLEAYVFVALAISAILYAKGKYWASSGFLAIAISLKLFPAVFLVLFLSERKYKELIFCVLLVVVLTFFSMLFVSAYFIDFYSTLSNMNLYQDNYVIGDGGLNFGNSLYGIIRVFAPAMVNVDGMMLCYLLIALIMFALVSLYILLIEKVLWKKVLLLSISMCLLPYVSCDYKLIYLLIPLLMYFNTDRTSKYDLAYVVLFGLLLIPKNYMLLPLGGLYDGVLIDPLLMLLFINLVIFDNAANISLVNVRSSMKSYRESALVYTRRMTVKILRESLAPKAILEFFDQPVTIKFYRKPVKKYVSIIMAEAALILLIGTFIVVINPYIFKATAESAYDQRLGILEDKYSKLMYFYNTYEPQDEEITLWIHNYESFVNAYGVAYSNFLIYQQRYEKYCDKSSEKYEQMVMAVNVYYRYYVESQDYLNLKKMGQA